MSHATNASDPGWPELLPPDRETASPARDSAGAAADPDDDLFGDWEPRRRANRATVLLAAGLLVVAGFASGAVVAKRSSPAATGTGAAARLAGTGGAGREGFGGFAGFGAAGGAPGAGAGTTGGTGGQTGSAGAGTGRAPGVPVVVGTVQSVGPARITVKNFAGVTVVVHVAAGTPVTTPGLGGLKKGQTVSVEGTKASDGSVTATAVVSRS